MCRSCEDNGIRAWCLTVLGIIALAFRLSIEIVRRSYRHNRAFDFNCNLDALRREAQNEPLKLNTELY